MITNNDALKHWKLLTQQHITPLETLSSAVLM
jgi:hypothetical protein